MHYFLARLASRATVPALSSFTNLTNFNCFTPYFHRSTEFTFNAEAECAARCLLSCERPQATDNNLCQYYKVYGNRCVTGSLLNQPSTTGLLENPIVRDTNAFAGTHPLVPIRFRNPATGTLDLATSFPTTSRDDCNAVGTFTQANKVFTLNGNTIELTGGDLTSNTLTIPAGHATNANGNCNIYIQNRNNLQMTLTLTTLAGTGATASGNYQVIIGRASDNGVRISDLTEATASATAANSCVWRDELAVIQFVDATGGSTADPATNVLTLAAAIPT